MTGKAERDPFGLDGAIALITGASGGIGSAIARRLANAGAAVALQYGTNRELTEQIATEIEQVGGKAIAIAADLENEPALENLLMEISADLGPPGILVNCAADQSLASLAGLTTSDWARMMNINLTAPFILTRHFATMRAGKSGVVINISSIEGTRPASGHGHYATSKAALEMLTKATALEFGSLGIRANAIAPGLIARPGLEKDWPEGVNCWQSTAPLGRLGQPEDIALAVQYLASPASAFITGTVLTVDGGMSATPGW